MRHARDSSEKGHGADLTFALVVRYSKEVLGIHDQLLRVDFRHAPNGPVDAYEDHFETPVRFGCEDNALVFSSELLDRSGAKPDQVMAAPLRGSERAWNPVLRKFCKMDPWNRCGDREVTTTGTTPKNQLLPGG